MENKFPLYKYWDDYPNRDVEYIRWYPPTLGPLAPESMWEALPVEPDRDIAFYVHVPFCQDICPYCPFNKYSMRDDRASSFMEAIDKEIRLITDQPFIGKAKTQTGYFGGGTPTALATADLIHLIEMSYERFDVVPGAEMTVEANPDTVDLDKLKALVGAGINRISFGVQSFNDRYMPIIGRTHTSRQAMQAIELARKAGIDNIAIDLMYRLPGQTISEWEDDLNTALEIGIDHISTYCLFLDPGTRLYNDTLAGNVAPYPEEETEIAMYQLTQDRLGESGFIHYTINDFAVAGKISLHHAYNWQAPQGTYVGLGPGAFSFVSGGDASFIYCTTHALREYSELLSANRMPVKIGKRLSRGEELSRYMVLGLKFLEVSKDAFRLKFGLEMDDVFGDRIALLQEWGLVESDARRVWMTSRGKHYATNVLKAFYTSENWRKPQPIGVELLAGKGASMASITPLEARGPNQ
jgi:oxygen-independent coproporphyrinogen-3 oxidase